MGFINEFAFFLLDPEPEPDVQAPPLYVKLPPEPVYQQNLQNSAREVKPPTPPEGYGISGPPPNVPPPPIPPPPHPSALARELDFIPISKDGSSAGNRGTPSADTQLAHFTRKQIKFLEKLGDGQFGEVSLYFTTWPWAEFCFPHLRSIAASL